jgi:EAL domain-containing protein (putative c-di-GMP-specific phosphodiesterase class I)
MTARVAETLALENKLLLALDRGEFVLHYQPKTDLAERRIVGVEALIRWQSPELGLVPPMQFIPLMEETGLILEAGSWALEQAVRDYRRWTTVSLAAPRIAVNVSAVQLRRQDFVETVRKAIGNDATPPGIDLEITESLIMEDIEGNIRKLKAVRDLGIDLAIDDFGTGYSSLAYLARLPVRSLKIDRSFIITMLEDANTMTLVSTIISLAHSLGLNVIAEGVDSEEQAKILHLLRCDQMQGFLISRPVPWEAMTELLQKQSGAG